MPALDSPKEKAMAGIPTEHLADLINRTNERLGRAENQLTEAIREMTREFVLFRGEVSSDLRWIKLIGWALVASAAVVLGAVPYLVYRATQIEGAVVALQKDTTQIKRTLASLEGSVVALRQDTTALKSDLQARDDRLGQALDRIEKALPPQPPRRDQ